MPVTVIAGTTFTVKAGTTDYSAQVRNGSMNGTANTVIEYTLGNHETPITTSRTMDSDVDFLFDGDSGFYMALYTAWESLSLIDVEVTGGALDGTWAGTVAVSSLSASYDAQDTASCTATFSGVLFFTASA